MQSMMTMEGGLINIRIPCNKFTFQPCIKKGSDLRSDPACNLIKPSTLEYQAYKIVNLCYQSLY